MKKYWQLFSISWQNGLVYKTSLFLWRLRQFLSSIMALTIWSTIYQSTNSTFGYDRDQMITYIFLVGVLQSVILASILHGLANRIYSGELSNELLKPVNIYGYLISQELADKAKNFFFIIIESIILFLIFKPTLIFPSLANFLFFILFTFGALMLYFFIQLIFGSIGFYSNDTWGPRFLFFMFVEFTAGKLFPLNILPQTIQSIIYLTPFPYLSFIQIQIFLEKLSYTEVLKNALILCLWIILTGLFAMWNWRKGIRSYEATGR